ncbi:cellulose binding domain-containing protein [Streptomyces toyocaensis]|uniref:cellulose binding domain-containing protein n=1 Tax=Streptomyces toyocaensis TaxID=55952 RepID=UPI000A8A6B75|nr:cellulose binding domain-containing protein [Streptomyces toyocaensis]
MWGGTPARSGAEDTVTSASCTASIPASGAATLGFTGTRSGAPSSPTAFGLNGADCSAA